jgi:hypothetical protein
VELAMARSVVVNKPITIQFLVANIGSSCGK